MGQIKTSRRRFLRDTRGYLALTTLGSIFPWTVSGQLHAKANQDAKSWPLFRGNRLATGVAETKLPVDLEMIWAYRVPNGAFEATPVIADGVCYIGDLDGTLHAINLADGTLKWQKKTESFCFAASPAFWDDRLYLGDIDGKFLCFDLKGNVQWEFEAQAEISSSANFYQDKVLFGSQDATLYCLDTDGKLVWKIEVDDQIRCSPTVVENRSFVAGCDGRLHIIDLKAGKELDSVAINAPTGVTPAVMGDHVFFGTEGGEVLCINWKQATVKWQFLDKRRREVRSSPAINQRMLVIGTRSKTVYGINPHDGTEVWTLLCKRAVDSSPVIVGDRVFVADTSGKVYVQDLLTGAGIWQKEMGGSFSGSPAVADGRVVIANDNGVVYCFGKRP